MPGERDQTILRFTYQNVPIATVIRGARELSESEFVTDEMQPLQVGFHSKKAGTKLVPHFHTTIPQTIISIQEVLHVIQGKVRVTFYTLQGARIDSVELAKGDTIIQMAMAHSLEALEDTTFLEVKQGPYPGTTTTKLLAHSAKKRDAA